MIPGIGPFVAAGPIMAALSGAAVGGAAGGIAGALIGSGIPEYEAKRYEGLLKQGNILISAHSDNDEETKRAKEIFERNGRQPGQDLANWLAAENELTNENNVAPVHPARIQPEPGAYRKNEQRQSS